MVLRRVGDLGELLAFGRRFDEFKSKTVAAPEKQAERQQALERDIVGLRERLARIEARQDSVAAQVGAQAAAASAGAVAHLIRDVRERLVRSELSSPPRPVARPRPCRPTRAPASPDLSRAVGASGL
jgi:hypothetical protein